MNLRPIAPQACRRLVTALTTACIFGFSTGVAAQEVPQERLKIDVSVDGCLDKDFEALLSKINLEALTFSSEVREWLAEIRPEVSITCKGKELSIRVADPQTDRFMENIMDIDEAVSKALTRHLAVAVVELIEAGKEELSPPRGEPVQSVELETTPPSRVDEMESKEESALYLVVEPIIWLGGSPRWISFGGSLGLEKTIHGWFVPTLDVEGIWGRDDVTLGTISALQLSGALILLFHLPIRTTSLLIGPGFRQGVVFWRGKPKGDVDAGGGETALPWNGPCAVLRISFAIGDVLSLGVGAQVGWYTYESHARVDGTPELSLEGIWFRGGLVGKFKIF